MRNLRIPSSIVAKLKTKAQSDNPFEACGLLAGSDSTVRRFYPLTNAEASPTHYTMIPEEQFAAIKDMRQRGLSLLAIWHSHPETEPRMSQEDIRRAYTRDVIYVILSLTSPEGEDLRAWRMDGDEPLAVDLDIVNAQSTARVYSDNSLAIGNTPLVQINHIVDPSVTRVLGKIEGRNPSYSVKCRIGAAMIWDAEKRGTLRPGMEIIEPTSGNTGIALAYVGAARGYKITLTMPHTMSRERRKIIEALGGEIILTEGAHGMTGAIEKAEELVASDPDRYFMPQQFNNPANPAIHERTTGPEIWYDTDGEVDVLIAGVGTGGTISGVSRFIKRSCGRPILSIAVEPESAPVIKQTLDGQDLTPRDHVIQGIGAGFVPDNLDLSLVDRVEAVSNADALHYAERLAKEEGILVGISSGAAMAVADRLHEEFKGKTVVVILPDSGERYLSLMPFSELPML